MKDKSIDTHSRGIILSTFFSICLNSNFLLLPGSILSGLLVYYVLSHLLLVPLRIVIPLTIILVVLIFALARYYCSDYRTKNIFDNSTIRRSRLSNNVNSYYPQMPKKDEIKNTDSQQNILNVLFVIVYAVLLAVVTLGSFNYQSFEAIKNGVFIPWEQFFDSSNNILYLLAAISLCFFMPGYAVVKILSDKNSNNITPPSLLLLKQSLPRFLVAYLFSLLITGLTVYVIASVVESASAQVEQGEVGYFFNSIRNLTDLILLIIYSLILVFFVIHQKVKLIPILKVQENRERFYALRSILFQLKNILRLFLNGGEISKVTVFASLFSLVVLYTYYLNDGVIVVDQWFHHGRAFLIGSGNFREVASSGADAVWNPPFFSSLLSGFFNLSGLPSVNAYVSINFLNIVPILAFYYFFIRWVPQNKRRAALLATTLFVLSSGFGWVYVVNIAIDSPPAHQKQPEISSINILADGTAKTYDIGLPTTFINVGHPDITSPFIIIVLPLGFTLLGLIGEIRRNGEQQRAISVRSKIVGNTTSIYTTIIVITGLSFLGILAHDEFYIFIIIACSAIVLFCPRSAQFPYNPVCSSFFASFLCAITFIIIIELFVSPTEYYIIRDVQGIPLIALSFSFVSVMWILYAFRISKKIGHSTRVVKDIIVKTSIRFYSKFQREILKRILVTDPVDSVHNHEYHYHRNICKVSRIVLPLVIVSIISYLYLLTFMFWGQLSNDDIQTHVDLVYEFNVPWYIYPMKLGLTGLLGLAFLLSYLFRKFEKEVFIFALVAVIALLAGPYYDEHRFGKYVMAGMASLAALLIYKLLNYITFGSNYSLSHRSIEISDLKLRMLINGIILGAVISFSGMSIFMFAGFVEMFTDVEDTRRDFPTQSEMQLFDFLQNRLNSHSQTFNIAMPQNEVDPTGNGLISKIYGFSALPRAKLLQSPLTLNASTLEGFYNLIYYSDTKYIVIPKEYIDNNGKQAYLSFPLLFSLDNFPRAYEDSNYLVLEVPPLKPPRASSSSSQFQSVSLPEDGSRHNDVALIYQKDAQEWLMPLFSSNNNNNNTNGPNADNSFISTILKYENESLTSPSSLFDFAITNDVDRILTGDDNNNSSNNDNNDNNYNRGISLSSLLSQDFVRTEKRQGINTIVLDSMDIANRGSGIGNDGDNRNDRIVLWSKPIPALLQEQQYNNGTVDYNNNSDYNKTLNYIEGTLRVLAENNTHRSNDAGILWKYGNDREYNLSLKGSGLELSQREKVNNPLTSHSNNQAEDIDEETEKTKTSLLVQNQEIRRERGIWYNIKILMVDNSFINIYVDDMLRMQVPIRNSTSTSTSASASASTSSSLPSSSLPSSITRVGIRSSDNIAEFQPIKIGHISPPNITNSDMSIERNQQPSSHPSYSSSLTPPLSPSLASYIKEKKYERHYYPLSMLALSNASYDTFVEGDLSAFSKKYVVLPFDPTVMNPIKDTYENPYDTNYKYINNLVKYYLEYAKNGGNLIVINPDYDYNTNSIASPVNSDGIFAQLLSNKTGNASKFNITRNAIDHSAIVETSTLASSHCPPSHIDRDSYESNTSYSNDINCNGTLNSSLINQAIAPFAIMKSYGKGNIIYLSAGGYFDTIGKSSKNTFLAIGNFLNTLGLHLGPEEKSSSKPSLFSMQSKDPTRIRGDVSITRIIDRMRISSGQSTIINSTSFSLLHSGSNEEKSSFDSSYNLSAGSITISNHTRIDGYDDRMSTTLIGDSIESQEDTNHENDKSDFTLKDAILKDLKIYGSYEVIVNSRETRRAISLPQPSSYNDYVEFTIPTGFTVTVKLSESKPAFAEFTILMKNQSSFQTIWVHGNKYINSPVSHYKNNTANSTLIGGNEIEFRDLKTDTSGFTSISFLMKSPDIKIINNAGENRKGQQDIALSFKKNSPQGDQFEIKRGGSGFTNVTAEISYVDNYDQLHGSGVRKQFITYLEEDMQIMRDDNSQGADQNNSIVNVQLPGSISESAKRAGIEIPWQKAISNTTIAVAATIAIITAVLIRIMWLRAGRLNV